MSQLDAMTARLSEHFIQAESLAVDVRGEPTSEAELEANRILVDAAHARAIETRLTGELAGPVQYDREGRAYQEVAEYEAGFCTDAFVTYGVRL